MLFIASRMNRNLSVFSLCLIFLFARMIRRKQRKRYKVRLRYVPVIVTIKLFSLDRHLHVIIMGNKEVNIIFLMKTKHVNLIRSYGNFDTDNESKSNRNLFSILYVRMNIIIDQITLLPKEKKE